MKKLKLILHLAKNGEIGGKIRITLRELAKDLGVSPQTVLRWLDELEKEGYIAREVEGKKTCIELTEKALRFLEGLCEELSEVLHRGVIIGEVVSGLGEGAYYVKQYTPLIKEYLGFEPYPGTLNVRIIFPKTIFDALYNVKPVLIPGFVKNGRTFGDVKAYKVKINGIEGAIVLPSRTIHPPKIAEVMAPVYLRKELNLKDGSRIKLKVME
ncbi:MAG TPA: CTP-dependent riboflavin kinase [Thermococcus paralvinellae]|uniref:Riboflavin kinase n=1 Tax=Thermococcus paralvinellae TaxID=582419 RepID=A0A832ZLV1_9EURY|nr:CTP-dependent riboflavin kinase [Thermococcus paralvinellae]